MNKGEKMNCIIISKNKKPLAGYFVVQYNFKNIYENFLSKISKDSEAYIKYNENNFLYYSNDNDITFSILASELFPMDTVVACLENTKNEFESTFIDKNLDNISEYGLNNLFQEKLKTKLDFFNNHPDETSEELFKLKNELELMKKDIKGIQRSGKNEERTKKVLEDEINKLKDELDKEKNKNKELDLKNKELIKEINELKNQITSLKGNNSNELDLYRKLYSKDEEIKELKIKLQRFPFELLENEKLYSINFISVSQELKHSIICKNTDIFTTIENKLYEKYPNFRRTENFFMVNGKKVEKYRSLDENKIKDNDVITLQSYEDI